MFKIKSEPVSFLEYLKPWCHGTVHWRAVQYPEAHSNQPGDFVSSGFCFLYQTKTICLNTRFLGLQILSVFALIVFVVVITSNLLIASETIRKTAVTVTTSICEIMDILEFWYLRNFGEIWFSIGKFGAPGGDGIQCSVVQCSVVQCSEGKPRAAVYSSLH